MEDCFKIQIISTQENAIVPIRTSERSPGYNLCSCEKICIQPNSSDFVHTGWNIKLPKGTFGRIMSKNAYKHPFIVGNEIINSEIEFSLKIHITNNQNIKINISPGDSIGYLLIERVLPISLIQDVIFNNKDHDFPIKCNQGAIIKTSNPKGNMLIPEGLEIQDHTHAKYYINDNTLLTIYSILGDSMDYCDEHRDIGIQTEQQTNDGTTKHCKQTTQTDITFGIHNPLYIQKMSTMNIISIFALMNSRFSFLNNPEYPF